MSKEVIATEAAPAAIGTYSQAVKIDNLVFVSGQIALDPATMDIVDGEFDTRVRQVFKNLSAIATAAGGSLNDIVKMTVYLTDLCQFAAFNRVMESCCEQPYPARAAIGVAELPKGTDVEADAILAL